MKYPPPDRPLSPEPAPDFERDEDARDEAAERANDMARANNADWETEALFERAWEEVNHVHR